MSYYKINWTPQLKKKAIARITEYLSVHGIGEVIMQSDDAIIEAPDVMSEIADYEGLVTWVNED